MSAKKDRSFPFEAIWRASRSREAFGTVRRAEEQIETCYRQCAGKILSVLVSKYGSRQDAEEVLQEAFLRLYEVLRTSTESLDNPAAWVMRVAGRLMLDRLRHSRITAARSRDQQLVHALTNGSKTATPERVILDRQRLDAVKAAVRSLSEIERACLRGRAEGLTLVQIAARVGLDFNYVHRLLTRTIRKLREAVHE